MTELYIKNMVCQRCILVVKEEIIKAGLHPLKVELGYVLIEETLSDQASANLSKGLVHQGFELLDNARTRLIENIKKIIIGKIHHVDVLELKMNWSDLLADQLHHDYNSLSSLFSSVEGITIEQYIIRQKIERVKELLFYDELNLSEISYKLGYSSVQHLSTQFKKVTGQTPTQYKSLRTRENLRKPLDSIL